MCPGCLLAIGTGATIMGVGKAKSWWENRKRSKAMQAVADEGSPRTPSGSGSIQPPENLPEHPLAVGSELAVARPR